MLKVYLVQFDSAKGHKSENLDRAKKIILEAKPIAGSLVLLPEMFATGYVPTDLGDAAEDFSTNVSGETARTLSEIANETNCTIMGAGITRANHGFYNHVSIYKPNENINLFKLKEIPDHPRQARTGVGNDNKAESVSWTIASFICYDLRFPEIFREATKKGANFITIQAAWPAKRRSHWETLLRARAIENQVYIAAVNAVSESPDQKLPLAGTSLIISPNGDILAEASHQNEEVISAELDREAERDYRKSFPVLEGVVPPEFL